MARTGVSQIHEFCKAGLLPDRLPSLAQRRIVFLEQKLIAFHRLSLRYCYCQRLWSAKISTIATKNRAQSLALDEYVLKMPLDTQIGSLGAENDQFKIPQKIVKK